MALERIDNGYGDQLVKPQFFINNSGGVGWTDGKQYTKTGNAPGRVHVVYLIGDNLCHLYEFVDAFNPAPPGKVAELRIALLTHFAGEKDRLIEAHRTAMEAHCDAEHAWHKRFKEAGQSCHLCGSICGIDGELHPGCPEANSGFDCVYQRRLRGDTCG